MGLYEGFGMGTMLVNFHMWFYVGVKSSFQHTREEYESKRAFLVPV